MGHRCPAISRGSCPCKRPSLHFILYVLARKFLYLWFRMTPLYGGVFPFCRNQRSLAGFSTVIIGRKTRFPFLSYPISLGALHITKYIFARHQESRHAIQGIFNTSTLLLRRRRGVKNGKFQIQENKNFMHFLSVFVCGCLTTSSDSLEYEM